VIKIMGFGRGRDRGRGQGDVEIEKKRMIKRFSLFSTRSLAWLPLPEKQNDVISS